VPDRRPITPPLPAGDHIDSPRLVLRDGTVASVREVTASDREAIRQFFHDLSPESRRKRFFTPAEPSESLLERMADSSDPHRALSLIVHRLQSANHLLPVAIASYIAINPTVAEVAFAVDDRFQGKGLSTLLLERLAVRAAQNGFEKFQASTLADNMPMLEVFRDSGFAIRSRTSAGVVELQLSLTPSAEGVRSAEHRDRLSTAASLVPMLTPRAVAVVGVSRDPFSIGRRVFDSLRAGGFNGPIYPVNQNADTLDGLPVYRSARDLPAATDLAVIVVPAPAVLGVVDDCAAAGVKSLVIISAGFAEAGERGRALQLELVERVRNHGLRMVGPNCMGLVNASATVRLNASFSPIMPPSGRVSLLSQSGALGIAILELATERHLGLSTFISVGNKADVSGNDLLQYWEGDAETSVILLYLESFGNPRRFARIARRIGRSKPIVVVKAGRTREGSRAAGSHTAALAASDVAVEALFQQTGVIRADTIDEMFDIAAGLDWQPLPSGRRVAIVTNAGGPGILAVDACVAAGLDVIEFGDATRARLAAFLPPEAAIANPVDMVASAGADEYRRTVEIAMTSDDSDALIVIFTPVDRRKAAEIIDGIRAGIAAGRRAGATAKTVLACVMAEPGALTPLELDSPPERVPVYAFPENAARALGKIAAYAEWRLQPPALFWSFDDIRAADARDVCRAVLESRGDDWLTVEEARRVLNDFGLPLVATVGAPTAADAVRLAETFGFPVVAKLVSRHLLHKSDAGAVHIGLSSAAAVRSAFEELTALAAAHGGIHRAEGEGVVIQPMIAGGVETMIGLADDPLFGPLIAFGLGGIYVEVLGDVRFRVAPLTDRDAHDLVYGIRGLKLLQGFRGHAPADIDALREMLLRISRLAEEVPEVVELDLNPVIALSPGNGCRIVDARIRVAARRGDKLTPHR
jgi:acetate---CoA ligase (ADP-forming)